MKTRLKVLAEINAKKQEIDNCLEKEQLSKLKEDLDKLEVELIKYKK